MALTYSRSTLLSLRFWWKNPTQLIKPLQHSEWTACKLAGISKPTRGTRGPMFMGPGIREAPYKSKCKIILSRDKRLSKRASVGRFFLQVPWPDLLSPELSCELKLRTLTDIINFGLNTIMPERSTKVHETDRPWLSVWLKQLIAHRQKAFASGNQYLFKI